MKKILRLFLMSVLCGMVPITMLFGGVSVSAYTGNSTQNLTSGADIRVMSYNTLVDNDENLGGWSWGQPIGNRGDKAAAAINYYKPDVIGLQENNYKWHVALRENLPDYDYVNADVPMSSPLEAKESLGKKDWMCTTMMYNTKTLELVDRELYGYSCNYWGCIQRMRYVSMALFKVKATGEHFVFISTHLDAEKDTKGQKMRRQQATELAEAINYYKETYGYPVISTGDYNSGYSDEPISIIREQAGMTSHSNNRGGIDYVLYSEGVTPKYFTVVNDTDLSGASDHKPIFADLALDNSFRFPTTAIPTEATTTEPSSTTPSATTAGSTKPTAFKPTGTTVGKDTSVATQMPSGSTTPVEDPIASAVPSVGDTTTATAPSASEPSNAIPDVSASEGGAISTTAAVADPESNSSSAITQAVGENEKTTVKDTSQKGAKKDNKKSTGGTRMILIAGIAVATVGVLAAVAAVLIRKKK